MPSYASPPRHDDEALPSYTAATSRDALPLLAPRVHRSDVFTCLLVSRRWHHVFEPVLWGAPHVFWGLGEKTALTSFLLFLRTVSRGRRHPETHTLSLRDVRTSIYTHLPSAWLSTLLSSLPHLLLLSIPSFPYLDHAARLPDPAPVHTGLQTLLLPNNDNATPQLLVSLLSHTPLLSSVDLSRTPAAAHSSVLAAVGGLKRLTRLKVRSVGLTDATLTPLLRKLGTRVGTLDVAGNALSDRTAAALAEECVAPPSWAVTTGAAEPTGAVGGAAEEEEEKGLTHIFIAANKPGLSPAGAGTLLRTSRMKTLDLGATSWGAEELVPELSTYAFATLRTLRVGWTVVRRLRVGMVPALRRVVLCDVPPRMRERDWDALRGFLVSACDGREGSRGGEGKGVKVVLEMQAAGLCGEDEGGDFSFFEQERSGDFSFFEEESGGRGEWGREEEREGETVETRKEVQRLVRAGDVRVEVVVQEVDETALGEW